MKILVTKWFGSLVVDGDRVIARQDFPRDAHAIADRLLRLRRGDILEEERALAGPGVAVSEERLRSLGTVRAPAPDAAADPAGADANLLREACLLVARDEYRRTARERDRFVVQSVRAMDEVTKTVNTLTERLRDWYALHYPEALRHIRDPAQFARAVAAAPDRASVAQALGADRPDDSIGAELTEAELGAVQAFARDVLALHDQRERQQALIEREARAVAPNLVAVVGPLIAARLISQANGLERLAFFPTGTVQTLGAENALFLHRKEGKRPPKHGILFQHPVVNTAPKWQRGRVARMMAGHALRAARLDAFGSGADRGSQEKDAFEAALARLRARPPPVKRTPRRAPPPWKVKKQRAKEGRQ
jgi:nucleolar protein 56